MRISDWSSDVCSSDLPVGAVVGFVIAGHHETALDHVIDPGGRDRPLAYILPAIDVQEDRPRCDPLTLSPGCQGFDRAPHQLPGSPLLRPARLRAARSDARRVGDEGVSTCRSRGWACPLKKQKSKEKQTN